MAAEARWSVESDRTGDDMGIVIHRRLVRRDRSGGEPAPIRKRPHA
jgi:hypothetical protein